MVRGACSKQRLWVRDNGCATLSDAAARCGRRAAAAWEDDVKSSGGVFARPLLLRCDVRRWMRHGVLVCVE